MAVAAEVGVVVGGGLMSVEAFGSKEQHPWPTLLWVRCTSAVCFVG